MEYSEELISLAQNCTSIKGVIKMAKEHKVKLSEDQAKELFDLAVSTKNRKQTIIEMIRKFNKDRDWDQFHSPVNLAKSILIEAGELLEVYQWSDKEKSIEKVREELADVLSYCYMLADAYGLDVDEIVEEKYRRNEEKYPIESSRGNSKKYDE